MRNMLSCQDGTCFRPALEKRLGETKKKKEKPMNRRKNTRTNTIRPMLLTIPQVAELLGLGRTKVYELIAKEGLSSVKLRHAA